MRGSFDHPGFAFIEQYETGLPTDKPSLSRCVCVYGRFLCERAGVIGRFPVDLDRIYDAFGLTVRPLETGSFEGLEGMAAEQFGLVFVREDGLDVRRRFTLAHELMEYLIKALEGNEYSNTLHDYVEGSKKERLCDWGAAEILMPRQSFAVALKERDLSLATASALTKHYETSLLATLRRMVELHEAQNTALIVWHHAYKKADQTHMAAENQSSLFGDGYRATVGKAVRVRWTDFPKDLRRLAVPLQYKSIPSDSLVAQVYHDGRARQGSEYVELVNLKGECFINAMRATIGEERCVISLFRVPPAYTAHSGQGTLTTHEMAAFE